MGFFMSGAFDVLFFLAFFTILAMVLISMLHSLREWSRNNHSPRLTVPSTVVTKRSSTSHSTHHAGNGAMHTSTSTSYYATFQVESGDRMELHISGTEYGMLAEGDYGMLTFQGTRYLSFERM